MPRKLRRPYFRRLTMIPSPVWAQQRCRISPPRLLAECCKKRLNQAGFVLLFCFVCFFWVCLVFEACVCFSICQLSRIFQRIFRNCSLIYSTPAKGCRLQISTFGFPARVTKPSRPKYNIGLRYTETRYVKLCFEICLKIKILTHFTY